MCLSLRLKRQLSAIFWACHFGQTVLSSSSSSRTKYSHNVGQTFSVGLVLPAGCRAFVVVVVVIVDIVGGALFIFPRAADFRKHLARGGDHIYITKAGMQLVHARKCLFCL